LLCPRCESRRHIAAAGEASAEAAGFIKGDPVRLLENAQLAGLSATALKVTEHNAASIEVYVSGAGAQADISIEGSPAEGGEYLPLFDPNASKPAITSNQIFDVIAGPAWIKARLANVSGSFGGGQGFTIVATPYISPGPTSIVGTVS